VTISTSTEDSLLLPEVVDTFKAAHFSPLPLCVAFIFAQHKGVLQSPRRLLNRPLQNVDDKMTAGHELQQLIDLL
jgi:hypothetical protein